MYGLTRGTITLLGAGVAGLARLARDAGRTSSTNGGYWAVYGLIAAAGLVMAFSQILGGWTKWGWPRLSLNVFLLAFLPVLVAAGWVLIADSPTRTGSATTSAAGRTTSAIRGLVRDLTEYVAVLGVRRRPRLRLHLRHVGPAAYGPFGRRRRAAAIPGRGSGSAAAAARGAQ